LTVRDDQAGIPRKTKNSSRTVEWLPDSSLGAANFIDEFEIFYRSWYHPFLRLLLTLTSDLLLAEDVVQETMITMKGDWDRAKNKEQPQHLFRIGIRILRRIEAHMRKENESMNLLLPAADDGYVAPDDNRWVIEHQDIVRAIRSLPRRQGEVAALYYLCDLTLNDVAETLSLSIGAVKFHLHHARASLRDRMDGPGGGTGWSQ